MRVIEDILMMIGSFVVALVLIYVICFVINKINYYRANKTKCKLLCKPHIYGVDWIWNNKETVLKCKKCGKEKKMYIDRTSFEEWFGKVGG